MSYTNSYKTLSVRERVEIQRRQEAQRTMGMRLERMAREMEQAKQQPAPPRVKQLGFNF
jgi:hypothetical protein